MSTTKRSGLPGKAARDETAFRHALKTGHRLRQQGQRLTDAAIIDAYEQAYNVAHAHGGAGRSSEMPPMRDRQTMAKRVRGYVTQSKSEAYTGSSAPGKATSSEPKALATMVRRGGKKAAERWKNDPHGEYARTERKKLQAANPLRQSRGKGTRGRVLATAMDILTQTGKTPSGRTVGQELGITRQQPGQPLSAPPQHQNRRPRDLYPRPAHRRRGVAV